MKFQKILTVGISDASLDKEYWAEIDELADVRVGLSKDSSDILKEIADTDCVLVAFGVPVTAEMIAAAPQLKYIGVLATAYGKIDIESAKQKNIPVSNIAGYSTEAVAEFSIAVILEHMRQLEVGKERGRSGSYTEEGLTARELKGSVFGVIGLGSIGNRVAELASAFGADVRYWSRQKKDVPFTYQDVDAMIAEADYISLNIAQTPETEKFLNKERLHSIKRGAVVLNTVPMECVDVDALMVRLAVGDITFIFDHSDEVSAEVMKQLSRFKNCIVYPPMAYITDEARAAKQRIFVENIQNFQKGTPTNKVN
jgi:phosphoglycerate dehydrogenase-like enzyme